MGGWAGAIRGGLSGLNEAAGNTRIAQNLENINAQARQKKELPIQQSLSAHQMAIKGLQSKLYTLQEGTPEYNETVGQIQQNIHAMREIVAPDQKLGAMDWLERHTTDRLHITNHDKRMRQLAARQQAGNSQDKGTAAALAQGTVPYTETPAYLLAQQKIRGDIEVAKARLEAAGWTKNGNPVKVGNQWMQPFVNKMGETMMQPMPAGYSGPSGKPIKGTMVRSKQSPTGFAQTWVSATDPNKIVAWQPISPSRWYIGFQTQSTTTDPFGVTSSTSHVMSPAESGFVDLTGAQQMPAESGDVSAPAPIPPSTPPRTVSKGKTAKPISSAKVNGKTPALDSQGHIPAESGINPMVRSAANQLLDGMDIDKLPLPARDKQMAATVAARYGWGQGLFTPKEKLLINEAATKLDAMKHAPSLRVLDGTESRLKLAAILHASQGKPGLMASAIASVAAGHLTPDEQDFLRRYNATVGVISGLGPLTRGKAATEATINRLMLELPSVLQSGSASDAKQRIDQLLQEIKVAESTKGNTGLGVNNNSDPLGILQ